MATEVGSAYVSVIPSAKGFGSTLTRGIGRQVDTSGRDSGKRFGRGFSGGAGGAIAGVGRVFAPLAAAAATLGGIRLFGTFVSDARESARIAALTTQAIKSTGGAANVTAKDVGRLSTAISNKTGVDDEQIQSGANLLLTFTNVRNELGRGNKIFNRANQAVTDMSAALGQDTKSSAIQLGKALNDPVKGITALSRVGVAFTADQKDQIKTLVASGNTLDAQKIILKELGKEFGGAAAAMATPGDRLKVSLGNLSESIGAQLLPVIDRFAKFMVDRGLPALVRFGGFLKANVLPVIKQFGTFVLTTVVPALLRFGGFLQANVLPPLKSLANFILQRVFPALKTLANFILNTVYPVIGKILVSVFAGLRSAIGSIKAALDRNQGSVSSFTTAFRTLAVFLVTKVLPLLGPVLKFVLVGLGKTIGVLITVIGFLIGAFRRILQVAIPVFATLTRAFLAAVGFIVNGAAKALGWIPGLGGKLKGAANAFNNFKDSTNAIMSSLSATASGWGADVGNNFNAALAQTLAAGNPKLKKSVAVGTANKIGSLTRTGALADAPGGGDTIIVNNPVPERASDTVPKAIARKKRRQGVPAT